MHFNDQAIIISKKFLSETSHIITTITRCHGIYSGVITSRGKKTSQDAQEGNLISLEWRARLQEHLGFINFELLKPYASYLMMDKTKLYSFNSIVSLLKLCFYEREPHERLFECFLRFLQRMKLGFSLKSYIDMELAILKEAGYGLSLDQCIVTGVSDDLAYISPKSGCAVSVNAGKAYESKLLKLPLYMSGSNPNVQQASEADNVMITSENIEHAFNMTSYFFHRHLFGAKGQPKNREDFIEHVKKSSHLNL